MSDVDVITQEKDELTRTVRSSDSSIAGDSQDDTEVSTTQSDDSSTFNESTKVDFHATIQMQVKDATLKFQHRFEYGRDKTLKKLVDYCSKQLKFGTRHARPSVEVKAREVHKVAYEDLGNAPFSDFIDESAMEMDFTIDYTECPEVFWPFIHNLAMRTGEESEAVEVLQVAIAHFGRAKGGFSKTFLEVFEGLAPALTTNHLSSLVPTLIQILEVTDRSISSGRRGRAARILTQITKTHGNSLNRFALPLSQLVRRLFWTCDPRIRFRKTFPVSRPCCPCRKYRPTMDTRDCEWAADYLPLLFQHVLGGSHVFLLYFWPLLKEEIKQAEVEGKDYIIPNLLFSIEKCLQHVDKANIGSDTLAEMEHMFKEEFAKYKEELAKFKEQRSQQEEEADIIDDDSDEVMTKASDEESDGESDEEHEDDERKEMDSLGTMIIQLIRRFPNDVSDSLLKVIKYHKNKLGEKWKEVANFVVEDHATDIHKHIALKIIIDNFSELLDLDDTYLRRLNDFIVKVLLMENHGDEEFRRDSCEAAIRVVLKVREENHRDKRWMISPLLVALLKVSEEDVNSGSFDDFYFARSLTELALLPDLEELSPHLPKMYSLCKAVHEKGRDWFTSLNGDYYDLTDYGRLIRLRIARESINDHHWPADKSAYVPSSDLIDCPDVVHDKEIFGKEFNGKQDETTDSDTRGEEIDQNKNSISLETKIFRLECRDTFDALTPEEKRDLHESIKSFYTDSLTKMMQVSPESVGLFIVLYRLFKSEDIESLKVKATALGVSSLEWLHFLHWATSRITIGGPILFRPIIFRSKLRKLIAASAAATEFPGLIEMYDKVESFGYSKSYFNLNLPIPRIPFSRNFKMTSTFFPLVVKAQDILKKLPWDRAYDSEDPIPSFAVVDVFATAGIDRLGFHDGRVARRRQRGRQDGLGRAIVFGNFISVQPLLMNFIRREDAMLMEEYNHRALFIETVFHELFGHPSGKKLKTPYKLPVVEEIKAFAVSLILCSDEEVMKTAGCEDDSWKKIMYCIWSGVMRNGLRSLISYNFNKKKWSDLPHSWALYILLSVVYEAGEDCLLIEKAIDADGEESLCVVLDETKIDSVALPAVCDFVKKLQCVTATGNLAAAFLLLKKFVPGPEKKKWLEDLYENVYEKMNYQEGVVLVQPNLILEKGEVKLLEYSATPEGVIHSVMDRFTLESMAELETKWGEEKKTPRGKEDESEDSLSGLDSDESLSGLKRYIVPNLQWSGDESEESLTDDE